MFASKTKKHDVDMTCGSIVRHLAVFSFPLLLGNIFQQLYNMVDTWVVGNFVSKEAMAAVGTVGTFINVLIGFFMGLSNGAGVVIAQHYGAKNYKNVSKTLHTAFVMTIFLGIAFTGIGIFSVPFVLKNILNVPSDVYPEAKAYLLIYFSGIIGLMIYNVGSGILRSVGDSTRPFIFLVISAVLNTVLDLVFVLCFDMGVKGVAYATIIAQGVSAVLLIIYLMKSDGCVKLKISELRADMPTLSRIISIGIPTAFQLAITSFANMFAYSYINFFQTDVMSGYTAYNKIHMFVALPVDTLSIATTTFVAQNFGVNDIKRAKEGIRRALIMSLSVSAAVMIPVIAFAPQLVSLFNGSPEVIRYGTLMLRVITPFFLFCAVVQTFAGALRGVGNTKVPMLVMLFSYVVFRQIYLYVMKNFISNTVIPIVMAFPAGWFVCAVIMLVYYKKAGIEKSGKPLHIPSAKEKR